MKKIFSTFPVFIMLVFLFGACNNTPDQKSQATAKEISSDDSIEIDSSDVLENKVLSKEQQAMLKPEDVLALLKEGNEDFVEDRLTVRNTSERVRQAALGQYPKAVILSCIDSRVPVEDVFHRGIGDVFVGRVAGNVLNTDQLASMEYSCKVSGSKLVLVLGHEHCGAVKSAIDDVKLGNITSLLAKIKPAVVAAKAEGDRTSKNEAYVHAVCIENVKQITAHIRKLSPVLAEMEKNKEIIIKGAVYAMDSGKVTYL
ncbi:carbonic anhydrase family protein [Pedobacter frigidisoli]|uniref:carbonic anhydrase family protein n=1 Tax=Pedobacter frigidisoli TaxID=2530455 RepID=UPI00292EF54F|nr:carbonic anhydrase family protein [Pedobacter frigidisoli]